MFGGKQLRAPLSAHRKDTTNRKRTVRDLLRDPRPIAGGDGVGTLTADSLSSTDVSTLETKRTEIMGRGTELAAKVEKGEASKEERDALRGIASDYEVLTNVIAERKGDTEAVNKMRAAKQAEEQRKEAARQQRPEIFPDSPLQPEELEHMFDTPGEAFCRSETYAEYVKRFPGDRTPPTGYSSDPVNVASMRASLGMRSATDRLKSRLTPELAAQYQAKMRAPGIITSADASAGDLVRPQYLGLLEPGLVRPLTVRDLVTVIPTGSDAIEYVREVSREAAAAPVAQATASTGASGLKPEGGLVLDVVSTTVKTIAEWVAVTTRIMSDAPALRAYIDGYLTDDLALELEDQMVSGAGTGENFQGILNASIQTQAAPGAGESMFDVIRKGKTKVILNGRTRPTAVLVNPNDNETIDLLKVNSEVNHFAGPGPFSGDQPPLWGMRRVETEAVPAGTALVGDFRKAILFDRESTSISVGTVNDDFIRNILRVLAELRAAFGVIRPNAFCAVDLVV